MDEPPGRFSDFLGELKRRNVYRVAVTYAVVAFVSVQVAELAGNAFGLPSWFEPMVWVLLGLGLPVAVVLAWAFEMTAEGVRRTPAAATGGRGGGPVDSSDGSPEVSPWPERRKLLLYGAVVVLLLAGGGAYFAFRPAADGVGHEVESLAVLPLDDLSGKEEQAYFAEGMTEALINQLSKIRSLKVISRTSVMQYRDANEALPKIAEELGVDAILEGSVLQRGDRVRITAQLIHGETDRHLWSDSYERSVEDVLSLQAEVARAVADAIEAELTRSERQRIRSPGPVDPEAYRAYLKGRYHWSRHTEEHWRTAVSYFEEAVAIDSTYAPAFAGLADAINGLAFFGHMKPADAYRRTRRAVRRALELDETLAEAHATRARIRYLYDWDYGGAEESFRRALELNPNYAAGHHAYAVFLARMGRFAEAEEKLERALELDPLMPRFSNNRGWIAFLARDFRSAISAYETALELHPHFAMTHRELAWAYVEVGRHGDAIREAERALDLSPDDYTLASLGYVLGRSGEETRAGAMLDSLRVRSEQRYVSPTNLALVHLGLGNLDRALDWLEQAAEDRSTFLANLAVHPFFDPLRHRPRFRRLLERMELDTVAASQEG